MTRAAAAERTGDGRDVNRHNHSMEEVEQEVRRPVVQRLMQLIRFRNEYPRSTECAVLKTRMTRSWRSPGRKIEAGAG
jgi:sucrose phosphorylase